MHLQRDMRQNECFVARALCRQKQRRGKEAAKRRGKNKERKQRMLKVLKYARTLSDLARRFVTSDLCERERRLVV